MSSTLQPELVGRLDAARSIQDLYKIVNSLSVTAKTTNGVLYSGNWFDSAVLKTGRVAPDIASELKWAIIDETPRARLLTSPEFQSAFASILKANGITTTAAVQAGKNTYLFEAGTGSLWSRASAEFASSLQGNILAIAPHAVSGRIFDKDELSAAVNNPKITSINGIPRAQLVELLQQSGSKAVFDKVIAKSQTIIDQGGIAVTHQGKFILTQEGGRAIGAYIINLKPSASYHQIVLRDYSLGKSAQTTTGGQSMVSSVTLKDGQNVTSTEYSGTLTRVELITPGAGKTEQTQESERRPDRLEPDSEVALARLDSLRVQFEEEVDQRSEVMEEARSTMKALPGRDLTRIPMVVAAQDYVEGKLSRTDLKVFIQENDNARPAAQAQDRNSAKEETRSAGYER